MDDRDTIIDLKERINHLIETNSTFDKIQIMQLEWFIYNLDTILDKLQ